MERDRNGYLIVKKGARKYFVTPYENLFAVRGVSGAIERTSDGRQVLVRTEADAVAYIEQGGI